MTDRDVSAPPKPSWRDYRDPASLPLSRCAHCGQPVQQTYAMLADARRFCSSACYESWVRR